MKFVWLVLCALVCGDAHAQSAVSMAAGSHGQTNVARVASVSADLTTTSFTIPSGFVGLSGEAGDLINGMYQGTTGANGSFISVAQLLGAFNLLRIGGGSSESVTPPALTSGIAANLATFVTGLGSWKLNYNLDLFANNSATAATHAGLLNTAFGGTSKITFEMGNEPIGTGNFTVSTYITAWNSYYAAVNAAVPGANYAVIADATFNLIQNTVPSLTPGLAGLAYVSYHWYGLNAGVAVNHPFLLSSVAVAVPNQAGGFGFFQNNQFVGAKPQIVTESNTEHNFGKAGNSDVLASAAWFLNEAIVLASGGFGGINIHNTYAGVSSPGPNGNGYYNAIIKLVNGNYGAAPIFYGMYQFSKLQGQQIVGVAVGGNANVQAIATQRVAGKANIIIANNDVFAPVTVTPQQSSAWTTANVLKIASPNGLGCAEPNPTIGGQPIGESGAWSGTTFPINNGQSVTLGPCESALVQIQ